MFLSDQLEEILSKSGHFDLETCNGIIHAIADKLSEELDAFGKIAKQKGSIKSNVIYVAIERQWNIFNQFCKKHPEVPQALIDKVERNIQCYSTLVDEAVSRSTKTNTL